MSASRSSTVALTVAPPGTKPRPPPLGAGDHAPAHSRRVTSTRATNAPRSLKTRASCPVSSPRAAASSGWIRTAGRPDRFRWLGDVREQRVQEVVVRARDQRERVARGERRALLRRLVRRRVARERIEPGLAMRSEKNSSLPDGVGNPVGERHERLGIVEPHPSARLERLERDAGERRVIGVEDLARHLLVAVVEAGLVEAQAPGQAPEDLGRRADTRPEAAPPARSTRCRGARRRSGDRRARAAWWRAARCPRTRRCPSGSARRPP